MTTKILINPLVCKFYNFANMLCDVSNDFCYLFLMTATNKNNPKISTADILMHRITHPF